MNTSPDGGYLKITTKWEYDDWDRIIKMTQREESVEDDPNIWSSPLEKFDERGRLIEHIEILPKSVEFGTPGFDYMAFSSNAKPPPSPAWTYIQERHRFRPDSRPDSLS